MKPSVACLPFLAALAASPAFAQTPPSAEPAPGRYQFQPVEGGLARLDTATGEVSICRLDPVLMACDMAPSTSAKGAAMAEPRPSPEAADEAEFERALGRMKRVFRTFGDIAREFETETAPSAPQPNRT